MKKHLVALLLVLLIPCVGEAQTPVGRASVTASAATIVGPAIPLINSGIAYHSAVWNVTGTVASCDFTIDSSSNGSSWSTGGVITSTNCATNGNATIVNVTANYIRINVSTFTGTGSVSVTWNGYTTNGGGGSSFPVTGSVAVASGGTLTIQSGGTLTCAAGSTCPAGSGAVNQAPTFNNAGNTTFAIGSAQYASATVTTVHAQSTTLVLTGPFGSSAAWGYYDVLFKGDATGGAVTVTLGSGCTWKVAGGGSGAIPTVDINANEIDKLHFEYDGTNCYGAFIANFN